MATLRRLRMAGLAVLCLAAASQVQAEDRIFTSPRGVVELFTSQGCSSCPPADAALYQLTLKDDIVAISYHVDYWNYRGWADTLSDKRYSDRQYGYARTLGNANVYTPQAVLNGRADTAASDPLGIEKTLVSMKQEGRGLDVTISAALSSDELKIDVGAGAGKADIIIAYFADKSTVAIDRGENTGRTLDYYHAVTDIATIGMWSGKPQTITLPSAMLSKAGHDGCAILLQTHDADGNPGAILGAAILEDYKKS